MSDDMVRLSIGIEHIDGILADIDQELAAAGEIPRSERYPWEP